MQAMTGHALYVYMRESANIKNLIPNDPAILLTVQIADNYSNA